MAQVIDRQKVRELVKNGALLIEVLPAKEFQKTHLAGAVNLPLKELDSMRVAELDRDRGTIVYCYDYQ